MDKKIATNIPTPRDIARAERLVAPIRGKGRCKIFPTDNKSFFITNDVFEIINLFELHYFPTLQYGEKV